MTDIEFAEALIKIGLALGVHRFTEPGVEPVIARAAECLKGWQTTQDKLTAEKRAHEATAKKLIEADENNVRWENGSRALEAQVTDLKASLAKATAPVAPAVDTTQLDHIAGQMMLTLAEREQPIIPRDLARSSYDCAQAYLVEGARRREALTVKIDPAKLSGADREKIIESYEVVGEAAAEVDKGALAEARARIAELERQLHEPGYVDALRGALEDIDKLLPPDESDGGAIEGMARRVGGHLDGLKQEAVALKCEIRGTIALISATRPGREIEGKKLSEVVNVLIDDIEKAALEYVEAQRAIDADRVSMHEATMLEVNAVEKSREALSAIGPTLWEFEQFPERVMTELTRADLRSAAPLAREALAAIRDPDNAKTCGLSSSQGRHCEKPLGHGGEHREGGVSWGNPKDPSAGVH